MQIMEQGKLIFIIGIVIVVIWMLLCVLMEGNKRTYVILAGAVMDITLFAICRSAELLLAGLLGGLACGWIPFLISGRKYKMAVDEMHGKKNWTIISVIFFVMIFMWSGIAMGRPLCVVLIQ